MKLIETSTLKAQYFFFGAILLRTLTTERENLTGFHSRYFFLGTKHFTALHFLFSFHFSSSFYTLIFKIFLLQKRLKISLHNSYPSHARLFRFKRLFLVEFQQLLKRCELSLSEWKNDKAWKNFPWASNERNLLVFVR